jgi:hypothetical protein
MTERLSDAPFHTDHYFNASHCCKNLEVLKQIGQTSPHFLRTGTNLVCREHESVVTRVAKLDCHGVLGLGYLVCIVDRVARHLIDGSANGTSFEACAMHGLEGRNSTIGKRLVRGRFRNGARASITVCYFLLVDGEEVLDCHVTLTVHP